jgi:cell division protein FtsB
MPRRIHKDRSLFKPLVNLLTRRFAETNSLTRRRLVRLIALGFVAMFCYSLLFGTFSLPRMVRLSIEKNALTHSNRELAVALIDAARTKRLLLNDPTYIELVARTKYSLAYPDEIMYRYR